MSFSVSFHPAAGSRAAPSAPVDQELDDYNVLVIVACEILSDAGGSSFHIGGFGNDEWPVNVAYDLSTFIEQLPPLLARVRDRRETEVDLYSQGIERTLTFHPVEDRVLIHCLSRTDWVPEPEYESIARSELIAMLSQLAEDFARALKVINSELADVTPFSQWLQGDT